MESKPLLPAPQDRTDPTPQLLTSLQALIVQWFTEATEISADGDYCCAETRKHDAETLARIVDAHPAVAAPARAHQETPEDVTCEHGTAMDVHCCNCHSGFIFDRAHECPDGPTADAAETLKTVGRLAMLAVSDPHADSANYRKALREICNVAVAAPARAHQDEKDGK